MKSGLRNQMARGPWISFVSVLILNLVWVQPGWGDSGLSLNLYALQESHKYAMDQAIPIIGVIKNEEKWPINTELAFPQVELDHFLIATDPHGVKHTVPYVETRASEDMPPTSRWGEWETVPASVLPSGWQRSVKVDDLRVLFPVMKLLSGWYTIESHLPFSRFGWTIEDEGSQRTMGVLDNKAWHGTIKSKKLRIYVAPGQRGGRMKVRVEDLSTPESTAKSNVEVRIFRKRDLLQYEALAHAWESLHPLTAGNTDQGGWVVLPPGGSCLPEPEEGGAYVAVAEYGGEYGAAYFEQGVEDWDVECGGLLTRHILFEDEEPSPSHQFSIFGLDSVWIRQKACILSGDIGAQGKCESCLVDTYEVAVDHARVANGITIKGDSVLISDRTSVWDIQCNNYDNSGQIRGEVKKPLILPVWAEVSELFPYNFSPSKRKKDDITVRSHRRRVITKGRYRDIKVRSHAKLYMKSGLYHLRNLYLGSHSSLVCEGEVEIRIDGSLTSDRARAYLGSSAGSGFGPRDVVLYVKGGASFGRGNVIRANIFVNNGTLTTGVRCILEGSFIGRDIIIGQKNVVNAETKIQKIWKRFGYRDWWRFGFRDRWRSKFRDRWRSRFPDQWRRGFRDRWR